MTLLARTEGILPALESAHAVAEVVKRAPRLSQRQFSGDSTGSPARMPGGTGRAAADVLYGPVSYALLLLVVAFTVFTGVVYLLKIFGVLPHTFLTQHSWQVGSLFEMILLSMTLSSRSRSRIFGSNLHCTSTTSSAGSLAGAFMRAPSFRRGRLALAPRPARAAAGS